MIPYKTIQMSSAVKSKCSAVFVLMKTLNNSNKKKTNNKFNVSTINGSKGRLWRKISNKMVQSLAYRYVRRLVGVTLGGLEEFKKNDHFAQ